MHQPDELKNLLEESRGRTKRNDMRFWLLSSMWILLLVVLSYFVFSYLSDLDELKESLIELKEENKRQQETIVLQDKTVQNRFKSLHKKIDDLQAQLMNEIANEKKEQAFDEIVKTKLARGYVTDTEGKFVTEKVAAVKKSENSFSSLYLLGLKKLLRDKNYDSAQTCLTQALEMNPNSEAALYARGTAYSKARNYIAAEKDLTAAININNKSHEYFSARAFARLKLERYNDSYLDAKISLRLNPDNWAGYNYLGLACLKLKKYDEAKEAWKKAADNAYSEEQASDALENISMVFLSEENWKGVIDHAKLVDNLNKGKTWNSIFMAIAYDKLGQSDKYIPYRQIWNQNKDAGDIAALKFYLPQKLHGYLN